MFHRLKRHPWAISAHFDWSLALVYAVPAEILSGLLPPGLAPDLFGSWGFVAAALVQTRDLRPTWAPGFLGTSFFLAGYRIFVRAVSPDGRRLRGLYILGSETDSRRMAALGALLTHYGYRRRVVRLQQEGNELAIQVRSTSGETLVDLVANLDQATHPPAGSPFPDLRTARRYAGPMPFTFSHEPETNSLIVVEGARRHWEPRAVSVAVQKLSFLERAPFAKHGLPALANAFYVEKVDYHWKRGLRIPVPTSSIA